MKKIFALVLALMLVLGMTAALAAGDGTITIHKAVAGHTYTAYKIFSGKWDSTVNKLGDIAWGNGISQAGQTALYNAYQLTGDNMTAAKVADAIGTTDANAQAFANHIGEDANLGTGTSGNFATDPADDYVISGLEDGYYMIVDTYTPATGEKDVYYARYMIQKVGNAEVNNKADKPTVDKKIDGDNDLTTTNDLTENNTANIGDTVTYVITSAVPDMTGYKEYYMDFSDTLSKGLTYDANSLHVYIGGTELTEYDETTAPTGAFTKTIGEYNATTGTSISVHLRDLVSRNYAKDAQIKITYTATVNDNAVIGNTGNPNTVKLDYSNNPRNSGDGTPDNGNDGVKGETPNETVTTFVVGIRFKKVIADSETPLEGAVFNIVANEINKVLITGEKFEVADDGTYYKLTGDKGYTTKAPNAQIASEYAELQGTAPDYTGTPKYKKVAYTTPSVQETKDTTFQVTSGSDGIIELKGLHEGTYTFTEIQAPDGYNLLTKPIIVTISSNIANVSSTTAFAWSATKKEGTDGTASDLSLTKIGDTDVYEFTFNVENNSGTTLPETGGIGTTIFYIAGSILVLAAVIFLVTKRRMNANND